MFNVVTPCLVPCLVQRGIPDTMKVLSWFPALVRYANITPIGGLESRRSGGQMGWRVGAKHGIRVSL